MHIVKFIFLIFVSLNYYVLNAECLHQKGIQTKLIEKFYYFASHRKISL